MKWKPVLDVALDFKTGEPRVKLPRWYRRTHRIEHRFAARYAWIGLHLAVLAWHYYQYDRWILESLFFRLGWMEGDHPDAPTWRSLRFGNPLRILKQRELDIVQRARDGRDYAIARAREEGFAAGARLTEKQLAELRVMVEDLKAARELAT